MLEISGIRSVSLFQLWRSYICWIEILCMIYRHIDSKCVIVTAGYIESKDFSKSMKVSANDKVVFIEIVEVFSMHFALK